MCNLSLSKREKEKGGGGSKHAFTYRVECRLTLKGHKNNNYHNSLPFDRTIRMQSNGIQSSFVSNQMKFFIQLSVKNIVNLTAKMASEND